MRLKDELVSRSNLEKLIDEFVILHKKKRLGFISPEENYRWLYLKHYLEKLINTYGNIGINDRRKSLRTSSQIHVMYKYNDKTYEGIVTNLSEGGMFVQGETPAPLGSSLLFNFISEITDGVFYYKEGEIVYIVTPDKNDEIPLAGMGIKFLHKDPEEIEKTHNLVIKIVKKTLLDI